MNKLLLLLFFIPSFVFGNSVKPKPSTIKKVTIYLEGATIERSSAVTITPGENEFLFNNLSPDIDENSIQISGLNGASILSMNFDVNFLEKKVLSEEYMAIKVKIADLEFEKNGVQSTIDGYLEELALLKQNQRINSDATDLSLEKVKEMSTYYRTRTTLVKTELYKLQRAIAKVNLAISDHKVELSKLEDSKEEQRGEIRLKLSAKKASQLVLKLEYTIASAGWFPIYDIKAKNVGAPIEISYKANVYQKSGASWENVAITLSTGDPNTNNLKPNLLTKYLNFTRNQYARNSAIRSKKYKYNPTIKRVIGTIVDENGLPLPGVNVIVRGTSIGTQTGFDGNYAINVSGGRELSYSYIGYTTREIPVHSSTMNLQMDASAAALSEVVVIGYGSSSGRNRSVPDRLQGKVAGVQTSTGATKLDGLTQMKFEIKDKYTIDSNAEITVIEIDKFSLDAQFKHYVAPELNENVFLTATIKNWEKFDLLQGEANIYFEDSYAGKTQINPGSTTDSLNISLGMDPNVIVKRERLDNFKSTSFLGGNRIVSKGFKIEIKNNKKVQINLVLEDRIPVSQNKEIKVNDIETYDANYNDKTGIMRWEINLPATATEKKEFTYTLKYPKNRLINI